MDQQMPELPPGTPHPNVLRIVVWVATIVAVIVLVLVWLYWKNLNPQPAQDLIVPAQTPTVTETPTVETTTTPLGTLTPTIPTTGTITPTVTTTASPSPTTQQ